MKRRIVRNKEESRRKVAEAKAKKASGYYDRQIVVDLAVERLQKTLAA